MREVEKLFFINEEQTYKKKSSKQIYKKTQNT
jgi:hypothetical protein